MALVVGGSAPHNIREELWYRVAFQACGLTRIGRVCVTLRQPEVASPRQGSACDVAWPSRLVTTTFPSVGTASSVRRSALQLAVTLGGMAFTAGSISLQDMGEQGSRISLWCACSS